MGIQSRVLEYRAFSQSAKQTLWLMTGIAAGSLYGFYRRLETEDQPMSDYLCVTTYRVDNKKEFQKAWNEMSSFLQRQPGYEWTRMFKAIHEDPEYDYVEMRMWASMGYLSKLFQDPMVQELDNRITAQCKERKSVVNRTLVNDALKRIF